MNISEKIQELLKSKKRKGISQNEIAEKIGIAPSVLSKLISGNSKAPSADTVLAIAKYFNVSTDWLLGLSDNPTTDKATKSLCKTLGLSDVAIHFLQNTQNNKIRNTLDVLIRQHLISEAKQTQYIHYKNHYRIKFTLSSILQEITKYCELCKINDKIVKFKIDDNCVLVDAKVDTAISDFDNNIKVSVKEIALENCIQAINGAIRTSGRHFDNIEKCYEKEFERMIKFISED